MSDGVFDWGDEARPESEHEDVWNDDISDYDALGCGYFKPFPVVTGNGEVIAPIPDGRIGTFDAQGKLLDSRFMNATDFDMP